MNGFVLTVLAACVVCMPAIAGEPVKFDPGLWEHSVRVSLDGTSWKTAEQGQTCLSVAEAGSWDAEIREQIASADCTVDQLSVAGGRVAGVVSCPDVNQFKASIIGQYTPRSYSMDVTSSVVLDTRQGGGSAKSAMKRLAQWRGHRIGPC